MKNNIEEWDNLESKKLRVTNIQKAYDSALDFHSSLESKIDSWRRMNLFILGGVTGILSVQDASIMSTLEATSIFFAIAVNIGITSLLLKQEEIALAGMIWSEYFSLPNESFEEYRKYYNDDPLLSHIDFIYVHTNRQIKSLLKLTKKKAQTFSFLVFSSIGFLCLSVIYGSICR